MSDEYRRVLHEWAAGLLPDGITVDKIVKVDLVYEEGFGGSDVTAPDPDSFGIQISYRDCGGVQTKWVDHDPRWGGSDVALTMSRLLHELFAIAARQETS